MLIAAAFLFLFSGCKKDENKETKPEPEILVYFPLNHGSYWVYEHYKIDADGEESMLNRTDSAVIQRDSIVNGIKYAVLEGNGPFGNEWRIMDLLRDSSGIVINQKGVTLFQPGNFSDTLSMEAILVPNTADTIYTIHLQMQPTPTQVTVPAGTFDVINSNRVFTTYRMSSPDGLNPRDMPNLYSKDIGLVFTTYFYASSLVTNERRLTRYNIGSRN